MRREPGLIVDASLAFAVVLVVAAAIAADVGGERQPDAFAYLFAGGLGALMFVRRRFPILALMATAVGICGYYTAGYPPIGLAVPVAAALYSTAEAGRLRWAAGTAVGLFGVASFFQLRDGADPGVYFGYRMASTVGLLAAAIAIGDGVRARRLWHAEQVLRERQARVEREQEAIRQVGEERVRIARDLHDVLAHYMSVISLHSGVAEEALGEDTDGAATALGNVRSASSDALRELRKTVGLLRTPVDKAPHHPVAGLGDLDELVRGIGAGGLPVTVRIDGERSRLPATVDTAAYRIVQESLTNALRHAHADAAEVALCYEATALHIRVTDDGRGANADQAGGHGIRGMVERATSVGGTLQVNNRAEPGFSVSARLPLERA